MRRLSDFKAGLLLLALLASGGYLGFKKSLPLRHHFTIHAVFAGANNIARNSPVRIAGVNVGKVSGVHHLGDGAQQARVDMQIESRGLPLHADASAAIRPRIFLEGNFFIDLHPGSPSAATLGDGATLPIGQTSAPVQLDQILSVFASATRSDLRDALAGLSRGFSGAGGRGFNESLRWSGPAYRAASIVSDASLGTRPDDLAGYIKSAGAVAAAIDRDPAALRGLVSDFNTTAAALAAQGRALAEAIGELPRTLRAGRPALAALDASFPPLERLVGDLRPAVRASVPAIDADLPLVRQLRALVRPAELRGLVHDLRPSVPALLALSGGSVPLLAQVRPAASCVENVILPWAQMRVPDPQFPAVGPVYEEAVKGLPGVGGESRAGDANGKWFRALGLPPIFAAPAPGGQFMLSSSPLRGNNPPTASRRPLLDENAPCEEQELPNLATIPGPPPAGEHRVTVPASAQAVVQRAQAAAVGWARRLLRPTGLKVSSTPITRSLLSRLTGR